MSRVALAHGLEREIADTLAAGGRQLMWPDIKAQLRSIGYEIEPDSRCACVAKNMTTGNTYPCVTWGVREIETKRSAFHFESRRDENFRMLQELRRWGFAVVRGSMVHI